MTDVRAILSGLRQGRPPDAEAIGAFAREIASGEITDSQLGAFAMGICRAPLTDDARVALTLGMRDSGHRLRWRLPGPVVDKHSTGGVGDCVSLVLAPALAACGVYVPMISGRGLGHTGGTLDKLEAIPGYQALVPEDRLETIVKGVGCAIVGASSEIAPADQKLYAVRDVTGTVESLDLITASILSKKLAAGLEALVLDVKVGSGAFMKDHATARQLAEVLVRTASGAGCPTSALLTDMSQPLVTAAGNALEVIECLETLTRSGVTHPLWFLTVALGGEVLARCGHVASIKDGESKIGEALMSGQAAEVFGKMVHALGGPHDFVDRWRDRLPAAPVIMDVWPDRAGFVSEIATETIGHIVVDLGGGRRKETDTVNPSVGLSHLAGIGEEVDQERPLGRVHAATQVDADAAATRLQAAFKIGDEALDPPELVLARVG